MAKKRAKVDLTTRLRGSRTFLRPLTSQIRVLASGKRKIRGMGSKKSPEKSAVTCFFSTFMRQRGKIPLKLCFREDFSREEHKKCHSVRKTAANKRWIGSKAKRGI